MARHGENIRKRNDGRWEARYRIFDADKGRKTYRSVYGSTYEEAKEKRIDVIRTAEYKQNLDREETSNQSGKPCLPILFSQAADQWLQKVSGIRKYSTYVKYENVYKRHLEEALGSCPFSDMTDRELQEKISDHLSEKGLSESTRKSICCVTNQILGFAGRKYSIRVPVLKLEVEKSVKKPVDTFTRGDQSQLLACIYGGSDKFKIALLLCLYTGMRLGELCALKWTDFDFRDRTMTINRTVQRIAVKGYMTKTILMETSPKSESAKRTIPLIAEIMELLEGLKGSRPYVFGEDRPLEPRTMQYRFRRILGEAGLDIRNFHILRHTFATNCVESGMDVKTLSVILGHSDIKITLNRYIHPTMESKRRQIDKLPGFYGQIRGQTA